MSTLDVDIFTPAAYANGFPHDIFTRLRAEDPVHWTEEALTPEFPWVRTPGPGYWAVTRYADVDRVLRTPSIFSSHLGGTFIIDMQADALKLQQRQMLQMDPPEHSRLRRIINRAFTPRAVEQLRERVEANTTAVLDAAGEQGDVDLVTAVSAELPLLMLCEILGVPRDDRYLLFDWTNRLTAPLSVEDFINAQREMDTYCTDLSAAKRETPTGDIWSTLVNAELAPDEGEGETRLTDEDLRMFWQLLVIAGNETTRNSISGGVLALVEHVDQAVRLLHDPELMSKGIEEILRWVSPVQHFRRTATEDTELGGKQITAGDKVVVYHPSANRDEDAFASPFTFDVGREPNSHLALGAGPHFCLGSSLARLQLRTMFTQLFRRFPHSEITGPVERLDITFLSGIKSIPVRLRA